MAIEGVKRGILYLKVGFDGASSQSIYKQKFEETDLHEEVQNEESLFQTAIVPLKLVVNGETMWSNSKPSSSHFCRPLHLQYKKETAEVSKDEAERVKHQINTLHPFCIEGVEINFRVDARWQSCECNHRYKINTMLQCPWCNFKRCK